MDHHSDEHSSVSPTSNNSQCDSLLPKIGSKMQAENGTFILEEQLEKGRFGAVFKVFQAFANTHIVNSVRRNSDDRNFALKLEFYSARGKGLQVDYAILRNAAKNGLQHFCALYDRGKIGDQFIFIVLELMSTNLLQLRWSQPSGYFTLSTALRLATKTLNAIEELHSLGVVHRDIKASNFLFSIDPSLPDRFRVCISDFGLCRKAATGDSEHEKANATKRHPTFRGTTSYASLAAHKGEEQSLKDDLESWFYMVIEMISGELPWSGLRRHERAEVLKLKLAARSHDGLHTLLRACPKVEFRRIMTFIDGLASHNRPDYTFIGQLLRLAMRNHAISDADTYDWDAVTG